jgi:hypothetical protein
MNKDLKAVLIITIERENTLNVHCGVALNYHANIKTVEYEILWKNEYALL